MGFCILGGKENALRKAIADKLTALGQSTNIGATANDFITAIQNIYDSRYTAGQDSLQVTRKLTLPASATGTNYDITDNWYTSVDASAVYTAGQNSLKVDRKLTLTSSQTGSNEDIPDNWYTTVDASAVYTAGYSKGQSDEINNAAILVNAGNIDAHGSRIISTDKPVWIFIQGVAYNTRGVYKRVGTTVTTITEVGTSCTATASAITITHDNSGNYDGNYWVLGI